MRTLLISTALALTLTAGSLAPAAAAGPVWGDCPATDTMPEPPERLQCTMLTVPLDYKNTDAGTLQIAVSRLKATDPAKRRGALLLNFGGPGVWGLDAPLEIEKDAPANLLAGYDLIGFDPRGVQKSSPITCGLAGEQTDDIAVAYPTPNGDISHIIRVVRDIAAQCQKYSGKVIPHITTENTARDMDRIRIALGEQKISYYGTSYGTYLGAVYSSLFPKRTDRIVLDSVVNPDTLWRGTLLAWEKATEVRFGDFTRWAAARDTTYGLGATPAAVRTTYLGLLKQLDAKPAETPEGRMDGNTLRERTRGPGLYGYDTKRFPALAELYKAIKNGVTTAKRAAADDTLYQSFNAVFFSITCGEATWPKSMAFYKADVQRSMRQYPLTAGRTATPTPCAFWPNKPIQRVPLADHGPDNILLLQNLRDPATPYQGALAMRRALGWDRTRMITVDAGGHGSWLLTPSSCSNDATSNFLLGADLPADIRCSVDGGVAPR
ncbi:alpha/beta hydrolase [Kribbella antibiotica]|uniref:Alpha/beta hydrolase n=1 Tax=Kribbella antibiotica TaxID=190195 RepID=A0A4R4ZHN9_9ACTN|nr:alpha/beta hydrolase [Kribbella antibiotica]TDD58083.1 alpha/beta hydrolase [Kribbella antibiotica]